MVPNPVSKVFHPWPSGSLKFTVMMASVILIAVCISLITCDSSGSDADDPVLSGQCGDYLTWNYDAETGALTITGSGQMCDYRVGDVRWGGNEIRTVSFPDGLTEIGEYSFYSCSSLSTITIPSNVTSVGRAAFWNCTSLKEIIINDSELSIGNYAFGYCTSLETISFGKNVQNLGDSAFTSCESLISVTIPNSIIDIGKYCFKNCTSLESFVFGNSISSIQDQTLNGCNSLSSWQQSWQSTSSVNDSESSF